MPVDKQKCRRPQNYVDKPCLHYLSAIPPKVQRARLHFWRSLSAFGGEGPWKGSSAKFVCIFRRTLSAKRAPFVCICRQSLSAKSRRFSVPWAFPFLALKRFVCILDKPCLQIHISLSVFADKPCLHNRGRLRVPWTFPLPPSKLQTNLQTNLQTRFV